MYITNNIISENNEKINVFVGGELIIFSIRFVLNKTFYIVKSIYSFDLHDIKFHMQVYILHMN